LEEEEEEEEGGDDIFSNPTYLKKTVFAVMCTIAVFTGESYKKEKPVEIKAAWLV
jgi:hypothetical protein